MSSANEMKAIPSALRQEVWERDLSFCRVCGRFLGDRAALHHIHYGGDYTGMGGRRLHTLENIVTVCWLPGDPGYGAIPCHSRVHSDKGLWIPLLETVVQTTGLTAFELRRASAPRAAGRSRPVSTTLRASRPIPHTNTHGRSRP